MAGFERAAASGSRNRVQVRDSKGRFVDGKTGIEWVGLALLNTQYQKAADAMHAARIATANELGAVMEAYAKSNAPWQDRTGDAREGLHTIVVNEPTTSVIWLGHGNNIYYGFFLENYTYAGVSYAIIMPTIEHFGGQVMSMIKWAP